MDELHVDLHDYRGRLGRLAAGVVIGAIVTVVLMGWIRSVSVTPSSDPMGGSLVGLVAICIFVLTCAGSVAAIGLVRRRLARRA